MLIPTNLSTPYGILVYKDPFSLAIFSTLDSSESTLLCPYFSIRNDKD